MKLGLPISLMLHIGVFGGFTLFAAEAKPLSEARIIPVEILTVAPETNVSAAIKPRPKQVIPDVQPEIMTSPTPMENADEVASEVLQMRCINAGACRRPEMSIGMWLNAAQSQL